MKRQCPDFCKIEVLAHIFATCCKIVLKRRDPYRSTPFDLAACCLGFAGFYPANCSHIRSRLATA